MFLQVDDRIFYPLLQLFCTYHKLTFTQEKDHGTH